MPTSPKRPCRAPMCPALVESGFCDTHRKAKYKTQAANRESFRDRGYDSRWPALRIATFVRDGWTCQGLKKDGTPCGWAPDLVLAFREEGMGVPSTAALLEILTVRFHRKEVHFHADHIIPGKERPDLFYRLDNLQTMCSSCHSRKTMLESVQPLGPYSGRRASSPSG